MRCEIGGSRWFNLTGPGEPWLSGASALCRRAAKKILIGEKGPLEVGNTASVRDFLDVRDAAAGLQAIMDGEINGECNVCSGIPTQILELVESVCKLSGLDGFTESDTLKNSNSVEAIYGDSSRLNTAGWIPEYTFHESLKAVWNEALKDIGPE